MKHARIAIGFAVAALVAGSVVWAPAPSAQAATELQCTLSVQHPHGSTHVSGTINVVAVTTCPVAMTSIYIDVELNRTSGVYTTWTGTPKYTYGKKTAQGNAATSCSAGPGTFQGWAITTIVPPAGYVLTGSGTSHKYGTAVSVACGLAAAAAPQIASDTITISLTKLAGATAKS
jgi:hypothetical protein